MLDNHRMVYWMRESASKFKLNAGFMDLKTEEEKNAASA
jgi:hypothetical protein